MKKVILLLSAAYANGGAYCDAGATLAVGDGKNEITAERAKDLAKSKYGEISEVPDEDADANPAGTRGGNK